MCDDDDDDDDDAGGGDDDDDEDEFDCDRAAQGTLLAETRHAD